jgi:hypothetical protein
MHLVIHFKARADKYAIPWNFRVLAGGDKHRKQPVASLLNVYTVMRTSRPIELIVDDDDGLRQMRSASSRRTKPALHLTEDEATFIRRNKEYEVIRSEIPEAVISYAPSMHRLFVVASEL